MQVCVACRLLLLLLQRVVDIPRDNGRRKDRPAPETKIEEKKRDNTVRERGGEKGKEPKRDKGVYSSDLTCMACKRVPDLSLNSYRR